MGRPELSRLARVAPFDNAHGLFARHRPPTALGETRGHRRGRAWLGLIAVTVMGAIAALYRLGAESIWYDEAVSISYARMDWTQAIEAIAGRDTNGSLYYLLLRGWVALFGHGEGPVRALSAVAAIASLPVVVAIGLRSARPWMGIGAALLLAVSYTFAAYAREARMYALVMLVSIASTYLLLVAADRRRLRWMVAYGVVAGLGVYAHVFMLPVIAAQSCWLLQRALRARDRRSWNQAVVGIGAATATTLPLLPFVLSGNTTPWIPALSSDTLTWTFLALAGSSPLMLLVAAGLSVLAAVQWFRELPRSDEILLLMLCAAMPIVLGIAVSAVRPALVPRYFIVAVPAICLVMAYALSRLRPTPLALIAFVVVLTIDGSTGLTWHQDRQKDDWRQATQAVASWASPDDRVEFYLPGSVLPFEYYVERLGLGEDAPARLDIGELEACTAECVRPRRIWLVMNYVWTGQTPPELASLLGRLKELGYIGSGPDRYVGGLKLRILERAARSDP